MVDIDVNAISAITSLQRPGKPDLLGKILDLFESNSPALISEIEMGFQKSDIDAVRAASHSLKSSAAYLGASELGMMCKQIEHAARDGNLQGVESQIGDLRSCYEETIHSLLPLVSKAA